MAFDNTLRIFRFISKIPEEELYKWISLIKESMKYVESLVTKTNLTECDEARLDSAAAVYAYYRYVSYSIGEESNFSAGDISVTVNNNRFADAELMWKKELDAICDLIAPKTIFRRVQ